MGLLAVKNRPGSVAPTGPARVDEPGESGIETQNLDRFNVVTYNGLIAYSGQKVIARSRAVIDSAFAHIAGIDWVPPLPYRHRLVVD